TLIYYPHMIEHFKETPALFILAVLNMLAIANIPREISRRKEFFAFLSSCASIAALLSLFAFGIFPNFVLASNNPELSLNIYNSASSQKTLNIMLIIAMIGVPFVLAYTISIYWIFRGKVKLTNMSY
ncbi:MAG: cytochrome d ubiquinol oxidase subunit II, partial [Ignavibacteriaceae bacterium]